jgi:hydroxymethylpyrimidine pyrophosphatase-like HAD family hydrolase
MKLPLYVLDIDEDLNDETEVFAVGLVLQPAIERNWRAFASEKISFDFDGTLSTSEGQDLAKQFIEKGATVYIVSARNSVSGIYPMADKLGIPHSNVFAVGSNESKVAKILELSIVKHFDNNADVVAELGKVGQKFVEPTSGETQEEFMPRCIKYVMDEGSEQEQAIAICYSKWENRDSKFSKQIDSFKSQEFSVINEEKRLLGGFLMTADQPIYRRDEDGSEYYVTFPASAIEKIVKKMAKKGKALTFNINHDDSQPAEQCYLMSHFIIDSKLGVKTPEGFTPAKDGSWFGFVKVDNEQVWEKVKSGEIKGFSVEGYFNDHKLIDAERNVYEEIKNKLINNMNFNNLKNVLGSDLTAKLKQAFDAEQVSEVNEQTAEAVELALIPLMDGSASVSGVIAVGEAIKLVMPDGTEAEAPNGEHTLQSGVVIKVEEGKIIEVKEVEEEMPEASPLTEEVVMSRINEALATQAAEFTAQIESLKAQHAIEMSANAEKVASLFKAVEILSNIETPEAPINDAKRVSVESKASKFNRLVQILNKQK